MEAYTGSSDDDAYAIVKVVEVTTVASGSDTLNIGEEMTFGALTYPSNCAHKVTVTWNSDGGTPATGNGSLFTASWSTPGTKTVTAYCGNSSAYKDVTVIAPLDVEIVFDYVNQPSYSLTLSTWSCPDYEQYLSQNVVPAAVAYKDQAMLFKSSYDEHGEEMPQGDIDDMQQAADNIVSALNGWINYLDSTTVTAGSGSSTTSEGDFRFLVREVQGQDAGIPVQVNLIVDAWYSTRDSFSPTGQLWTSYSPAQFTVGSQEVTGGLNGNKGKIKIEAVCGAPVNKTVTDYIDVPIVDIGTEETRITGLTSLGLEMKSEIGAIDYLATQINNVVDMGSSAVGMCGPVGSAIAGVVGIAKSYANGKWTARKGDMEDKAKQTYESQRNAIEELCERLQPGGLEDNVAEDDINNYKTSF